MVFSFSSICCYWGKWATNILPGVDGLPGNDGGPPAGNHGQHDGGGDLQGQADILHKVNNFCNIFNKVNIVHNLQGHYSILSTIFSSRVFDVASADLYSMGIMVVSYTIKDVSDEVGREKTHV